MAGTVSKNYPIATAIIMGGSSFSFPTAPSVDAEGLAYSASSGAFLPTSRARASGATIVAGLTVENTTAATSGTPYQYGPVIGSMGRAWIGSASVREGLGWAYAPASALAGYGSLALCEYTSGAWAAVPSCSWRGDGVLFSPSVDSGNHRLANSGWAATGLTTVSAWWTFNDTIQARIHSNRTDGASGVVFAEIWDRNAASITNAATMRLWSGGWTNNSDTYTELGAHYCDGSLWLGAGNSYSDDGSTATGGVHYGAGLNIKSLSAVLTIAAAATTTSTVQIPAGAVVLGVSCRVTTVIPTAATFSVGHAGSAALWGTGISTAAGTTNTGAAVPALFASATSLLITPNASPADNSGRLRVVIHYYLPTAPTS